MYLPYSPYNKQSFIERIKDLGWLEMIDAAEREVYSVERDSDSKEARRQGSVKYAQFLKGLLFWLRYGNRPAGLSDGEFQMLRPLCQALIDKQQFKPEAIDLFEQERKVG